MQRMRERHLAVPIELAFQPLSPAAQHVSKEEQTAASAAPPVEKRCPFGKHVQSCYTNMISIRQWSFLSCTGKLPTFGRTLALLLKTLQKGVPEFVDKVARKLELEIEGL
jgi:hypothetical protein